MSRSSGSSAIGFLEVLAIVFVALKLTGYINWSWWWVLSPLWIPVAIAMFFLFVAMTLLIAPSVIDRISKFFK